MVIFHHHIRNSALLDILLRWFRRIRIVIILHTFRIIGDIHIFDLLICSSSSSICLRLIISILIVVVILIILILFLLKLLLLQTLNLLLSPLLLLLLLIKLFRIQVRQLRLLLRVMLSNRFKIRVRHAFAWRQSFGVIIAQQSVDKIQRLIADIAFVVRIHKLGPRLALIARQDTFNGGIQSQIILLNVLVQAGSAQHFRNLHQLVVVVAAMKEGLLLKRHTGKHATQRPHVQRVIVHAHVHQQFWPFKVARRHSYIILLLRMIKLGESPVDESQRTRVMVNHHIVRFDIAMHDAARVAVVECFQNLINVVAHVPVCKRRIQRLKIHIVDILKDKRRNTRHWIFHRIQQLNNVWTAFQIL
mmetsp:Transcript_2789/g.5254  ORF Transcript_2789/g.5254 Transcript_2789/m.5254 type:complete len:360 (-) Transcript_2789:429-1508(-)